jgi:hypothetical protein
MKATAKRLLKILSVPLVIVLFILITIISSMLWLFMDNCLIIKKFYAIVNSWLAWIGE